MVVDNGSDDTGLAPRKYTWQQDSSGVLCYRSPVGGQTITGLWEVAETTEFHDDALAEGTRKINAILSKVESSNENNERVLSFIEFQNRLMLVWARYGVIGPHDDEATVRQALKLRA